MESHRNRHTPKILTITSPVSSQYMVGDTPQELSLLQLSVNL